MSPASYLTAPPRVAADIVAMFRPAATIRGVSSWAVYGTLIVAALAVAGALAFLVARILQAWRTLKRLRRNLGRELHRLADLGEATVEKAAAALDNSRLDATLSRLRVTLARLGEGVDARRRLLPVPIARVRNVLSEYRRTLESLGAERTLVVATSAVREAENGEAFLGEVEWSYGFSTMLLSGEEEGRLTRRGVGSGREPDPGTLILDIGGGSTELIVDEHHD